MNVLKQCRNGLMVYNTNDTFIGRSLNNYGEYSQAEVDLFSKFIKTGMNVIDVGANIGCHTLHFSKLVGSYGKVFAYEPQRLSYYTLCANITLNNITNVYCLQNAVGNSEGRINVPELDYRKENNFGGISLNDIPENCEKCSVRLIRLDDQKMPHIHFLKIDVEGMEADVLSGAREMIMKYRPLLYVENDRSEYVTLLVKLVKSFGYNIYFHAPPLYNINNFSNNQVNIFGSNTSVNMFCHPEEVDLRINPDELKLVRLEKDGKIIFKHEDNSKQVHYGVINDVLRACNNAASYYYTKLCEHEKAVLFAEMAINVKNDEYEGYYQAAMAYCKMCNYRLALKYINMALERNPQNFKIHLNKATILAGLGRYYESIEQYRKAISINPDAANAHFYLACALIATEQYKEGYEEHEWRFKLDKVKQFVNLLPKKPMWNGEPLNGKKILLFCEQGAGDLIHYIRYAKKLDGHVTVACPKEMIKLISQCEGIDEIVQFNFDDGTVLTGDYDYVASLLSLPKYFGICETSDYIKPVGESKVKFDKNYFNVGIIWAGNDIHENDYARSCHLKYFEALQEIPKVKLHSLQKGDMNRIWMTKGKVDLLEGSEKVKLEHHGNLLEDFNDTANLIKELDLLISVDTGVAHIAGAIGKPVWTLLGFYPDYRWGAEKTSTVWYPSMKLFRQYDYGKDWNYVFGQVRQELKKLVNLS